MKPEINFAELRLSAEPLTACRPPRRSVMMQATLSCGEGAASVRVRNISTGGMMAECRFRGPPGTRIRVSMRGVGEVEGAVVWAKKEMVGIQFDEPIDPSAVMRKPGPPLDNDFVRPVARAWRPPIHGF